MQASTASKTDFDRVWALFQEIAKKLKETDRILTEKFKETDRMFKETDKQFKETDKQFKETDKQFKETDKQFKETDKKLKEVGIIVGRLGNRWGEFVEGMILPSVVRMFSARNIEIERVFSRAKSRKNGQTMEVDVLGANGVYAVVVEVKSKLVPDNVKKFIKRIKKFKEFFPGYADKKIIGAVAGITIDESVITFAEKQGLFVIAQKGEAVEIVNEQKFLPEMW